MKLGVTITMREGAVHSSVRKARALGASPEELNQGVVIAASMRPSLGRRGLDLDQRSRLEGMRLRTSPTNVTAHAARAMNTKTRGI